MPPACAPRYGRTLSSAACTRAVTSSGCSSCSISRFATSSSSASRRSSSTAVRLVGEPRHDPLESGAVERDDGGDQLLGAFGDRLVAESREFVEQALDAVRQRGDVEFAAPVPASCQYGLTATAGEWTCSTLPPLPVYMCTPHGRQGSKLRTARMMSMPLNRSGGFSSKIGVFCTASS